MHFPTHNRVCKALLLLILVYTGTTTHVSCAHQAAGACRTVRFTTYNTSLNRNTAGELLAELQSGNSTQAANVSALLQSIRPDVLVLNEFDYYPDDAAIKALQDNFLSVPQAPGLKPLRYPYVYTAPVNTGVASGRDFDHDGRTDGPADAFGYGFHPGQYGMVLMSQFPIDAASVRTFQRFLYKDMPGALLPTDPNTGQTWYSDDDLQVLRLSSKSHWDIPIDIPLQLTTPSAAPSSQRVHMLLHHPTPPAFDGPEGRNLLRNHDEIRLFADYVGCGECPSPPAAAATAAAVVGRAAGAKRPAAAYSNPVRAHTGSSSGSSGSSSQISLPVGSVIWSAAARVLSWVVARLGMMSLVVQQQQRQQQRQQQSASDPAADYLYDDAGNKGGLAPGSSFVIAGDHNADPLDGNSYKNAILQLLNCCNITAEFTPVSEGGKEAGNRRKTDKTPPETKTATFGLRVDYILPSRDLKVQGGAVFWPVRAQMPEAGWIHASDHRPVYLDVEVCADAGPAAAI